MEPGTTWLSWDSDGVGYRHTPVMVQEVMDFLAPRPGGIYVDGTLGGGGHARRILSRIGPAGRLIGIDRDADAIENAGETLADAGEGLQLVHDNFSNLPEILDRLGIEAVDGVLLDLGVSFHQIRDGRRGFSFSVDEPLDMRMDWRSGETARDLVNRLDRDRLAGIFREYGEERFARRIAGRIVSRRRDRPFETSGDLAATIRSAIPGPRHRGSGRIDPATRSFMALRIAVNAELAHLDNFLAALAEGGAAIFRPGGRLCILAFHSLEDRIVKRRFQEMEKGCICPPALPRCACGRSPCFRVLTRKPLRPDPAEVELNPMARSTRLRAAEKIGE